MPVRSGQVSAALLAAVAAAVILWPVVAGAADIAPERRAWRGGAVAGPIIGGTVANNGYYAYGPYAAPGVPPAWAAAPWSGLYGPAVPVAPGCYTQRQRVWTEYGWRWRTAPICY
ncbi:hypothetical protein CH341_08030 [Rhodoplanes roseus]|uniref:Sulfur globule protein n=2 Tax=Rhodoplanes roseus TaxID=29409 RepID=A0A327L0N3_9BRAD|nr:hypothetical protein CH341_08030 [Rhodoplanes roseus]